MIISSGLARRMRRRRVDVQLAKAAPELEVRFLTDAPIAEEDQQVFGQRPMDFVGRQFAQGLERSTPPISAPMIGVSLSTLIVL